ncbi:MAG: DUF2807 domain-containing protein [Chryseolinea sp.]
MNIQSKALCVLSVVLALAHFSVTAQEINRELRSFRKIVASPKINLILEKGDQESIRLVYNNVSADKINIEVRGHTLRLYLDEAKVTEKMERLNSGERRSIYNDASVTAYVTYEELEHLEIRGNQELTCNSPISAERFTLKAYGENEINLSSVNTEYMKTSLYGGNDLHIKGGKAEFQKYKLFGENKIDTQELKSYSATANSFGESRIKLTTQDQLRVNAFGESQISYNGEASVNTGLIFGNTRISKLN